jgi:hypothetical protein
MFCEKDFIERSNARRRRSLGLMLVLFYSCKMRRSCRQGKRNVVNRRKDGVNGEREKTDQNREKTHHFVLPTTFLATLTVLLYF